MASTKKKTLVYRCSACAHTEPKWLGRCPQCGEWNTLREAAVAEPRADRAGESFPLPIEAIDPGRGARIPTGSSELDRVLGGGLMRGSAVLLGGEPGIGKSTLLLQVAARAEAGGRVLYISGEESPAQIRLRAERLGCLKKGLEVFCSGDLALIMGVLDSVKPSLVVVDSVQTLHAEEAGAVPGTANQIKYCAQELVGWAKEREAGLFLVAHVTKEGLIAGPKAAEHLVDAVLSFEQSEGELRTLRASKNRFGSAEELGIYRMGAAGLEELADPSGLFLVRREGQVPAGVAVAPVHEGSRIFLVEIQALVVAAKAGLTRVYSERIDSGRVARVAAVLEKQCGLRFSDQDIYVNVAGGIRLTEPGIDLALAAALYSARSGLALPEKTALMGELSLAGELRPVRQPRRRAKAALAVGLSRVLGPRALASSGASGGGDGPEAAAEEGGTWSPVGTLPEAVASLFGGRGPRS